MKCNESKALALDACSPMLRRTTQLVTNTIMVETERYQYACFRVAFQYMNVYNGFLIIGQHESIHTTRLPGNFHKTCELLVAHLSGIQTGVTDLSALAAYVPPFAETQEKLQEFLTFLLLFDHLS